MNKLGLIIAREYLTKVKNKNFIFTTLLTPLGFLIFFIVIGVIFSYEGSKTYRIALLDKSEMNIKFPDSTKKFSFIKTTETLEQLKTKYKNGELDGILVLPKFSGVDVNAYTVYYHSDKAMDIEIESSLEKYLQDGVRNYKIQLMNLQNEQLEKLKTTLLLIRSRFLKPKKTVQAIPVKLLPCWEALWDTSFSLLSFCMGLLSCVLLRMRK